jgi:hypothetical protein
MAKKRAVEILLMEPNTTASGRNEASSQLKFDDLQPVKKVEAE